jgi:hypothetical protein
MVSQIVKILKIKKIYMLCNYAIQCMSSKISNKSITYGHVKQNPNLRIFKIWKTSLTGW